MNTKNGGRLHLPHLSALPVEIWTKVIVKAAPLAKLDCNTLEPCTAIQLSAALHPLNPLPEASSHALTGGP